MSNTQLTNETCPWCSVDHDGICPGKRPTYSARDTRPRVKYVLPDGRPIVVILDHGDVPAEVITFELASGDPLWSKAQPAYGGGNRRIVHATLAQGL
jgi:hypothetical protein